MIMKGIKTGKKSENRRSKRRSLTKSSELEQLQKTKIFNRNLKRKTPQGFDSGKLLDALNPSKKRPIDPSIEIIETTYFPSDKNYGGSKKNKKKAKFTDLNVDIGDKNVGGDVYKVESKKK